MNLYPSALQKNRLAPLKWEKARPSVSDSVVATSTSSVYQFLIPNSSFLINTSVIKNNKKRVRAVNVFICRQLIVIFTEIKFDFSHNVFK